MLVVADGLTHMSLNGKPTSGNTVQKPTPGHVWRISRAVTHFSQTRFTLMGKFFFKAVGLTKRCTNTYLMIISGSKLLMEYIMRHWERGLIQTLTGSGILASATGGLFTQVMVSQIRT